MAVFLQQFDQKVPCSHRIQNLSLCLQDMSFGTITFHILTADFYNTSHPIFSLQRHLSLSAFPPAQFHLQILCLKLYFKTFFNVNPSQWNGLLPWFFLSTISYEFPVSPTHTNTC